MRVVFFGTPEFAVPALDALVIAHEVALVVAQPDKPAGRGMELKAPAVALRARELDLPLVQPAKVREAIDDVQRVAPDVAIVVAYGKILPAVLLAIPKHGFLNIHGSILPRWRGAAPIQRAIEHGDPETGVTIMRVDEQLDHGPMLEIATTEIGADEHTPAVAKRLSRIGADALVRVLVKLETTSETTQDHSQTTYAAKIDKSEGQIDWSAPAKSIYDKFRAFDPWPGVFTREGIKLLDVKLIAGDGEPGTITAIGDGVTIACGADAIRIVTMQRPGKPRGSAADIARGLGWRVGTRIS